MELNGRLAEEDQNRMIEVKSINTKTAEDRIQELQGLIDMLIKEQAVTEKLQEQVLLQREIESLR